MRAKLAARRAALERGFAVETRAAVAAVVAEHGRTDDEAERNNRPLRPKAMRAATADEMLRPQTPVVCR